MTYNYDYNIDLLKVKINPRFGELFDHIISSGLFLKITLPTRFFKSINYFD